MWRVVASGRAGAKAVGGGSVLGTSLGTTLSTAENEHIIHQVPRDREAGWVRVATRDGEPVSLSEEAIADATEDVLRIQACDEALGVVPLGFKDAFVAMTRAVASDPNVQAAVMSNESFKAFKEFGGRPDVGGAFVHHPLLLEAAPTSKARGGQGGKAFRTFARRLRAIGKALEDLISRLQADLKRALAGAAARRVDAHGRAEDAAEDVGPWGAALVALASLIILVALIKVKGRR